MGLTSFLFVYVLGGITFLPLLALAIYFHVILTLPTIPPETNSKRNTTSSTSADGSGTHHKHPDEKDKKPVDADAFAGFFAVTREFTPAGVNAKAPERPSSAVGYVPQPEKPTIGQAVYRTIFEHGQKNASTESVGTKAKGRPKNVFYVVLRHRCLMLYDDQEQTEVRHVIPLANYLPNIYDGQEDSNIPEGELYIKRNAIRLSYKTTENKSYMEGVDTQPYYLFSEDCCAKEDFYFAMIAASEEAAEVSSYKPLPMETKDFIALVQRLHASEEHMQTRWLNALLGRVFLGIYKTKHFENAVRIKIAKKISRVAKPGFLSDIELGKIHVGSGLPYITNPRLREMNVDGSFMMEADVSYAGGCSVEISTVATIHLGARIRRREVSLVLSVALKKLEGHMLLKIKPAPSNRVWMSFETPPKMDLEIVPIVSSRQITYGLIVRAIESRIREVFAESMVYPNFDDTPFFETFGEVCRGAIWDHMGVGHDPPIPVSEPLPTTAGSDDLDQLASDRGSDSASVLTTSTGTGDLDLTSDSPSRSSTMEVKSRSKSMSSSPPDRSSMFGQTPPGQKSFMPSAAVVSADPINITASLDSDKRTSQDAASAMRAIGTGLSPTETSSSASLRLPPKAARGKGDRRLTDTSDSDRSFVPSELTQAFKNSTSTSLQEPPRSPASPTANSTPRSRTEPVSRPRSLTNTPDNGPKTQSPAIGALLKAGAQAGAQVKNWYKTRNAKGQQPQNPDETDEPATTATNTAATGATRNGFHFPKTATGFGNNYSRENATSASLNLANNLRPTQQPRESSSSTMSLPVQMSSKSPHSSTRRRGANGVSSRRHHIPTDDVQDDLMIVAKPAETEETSGIEIGEEEAAAWGFADEST